MRQTFEFNIFLYKLQKGSNSIDNNFMKARLVREICKQAIIISAHEHRNAAFNLCKVAHQQTNFLQIDVFGDGPHKISILIP